MSGRPGNTRDLQSRRQNDDSIEVHDDHLDISFDERNTRISVSTHGCTPCSDNLYEAPGTYRGLSTPGPSTAGPHEATTSV